MTTPTITDPAAREHVAALSAAVDVEASKARVAAGSLADAERRRRELRTLLGDHDAHEPTVAPDVTDTLAAQLAADPAAAGQADWTGHLDNAHADLAMRRAAWQGKRAVIERSIATVEAEMPALERVRDDARRTHEAAWFAFVWAAHGAIMAEFERDFAELRDRLLMPMRALETATGIYSGARLRYGGQRSLPAETLIGVLVAPPPGSAASGPAHETLWSPRSEMPAGLIGRLRVAVAD
jgi:hypothetical protein